MWLEDSDHLRTPQGIEERTGLGGGERRVGEEQASGNLEAAGLAAQRCPCWKDLQDTPDMLRTRAGGSGGDGGA